MLGQDELTKAIIEGQKAADSCGHFCRLGGSLEDGRYICHHNGVGSRDTDQQVVHANPTLTMNTEQLAAHLAAWIKGLHGGERRDLNAAMSTERGCETCTTWTTAGQPAFQRLQFVGEHGPELFVPNKRLATPDVAPLSVRINADTTALDRGLAEANQRVLDWGASFGAAASGIAPNLRLGESVRLIEGMRRAMDRAVAAARDFEEQL